MSDDRVTSPDGLSICSKMPGAPVWGCTRYEEDDEGGVAEVAWYPDEEDMTGERALARFNAQRSRDVVA